MEKLSEFTATTDETMHRAMEVAIEAAQAAGRRLLSYFREGSYGQSYKEDTSLQTTADLAAEKVIIHMIREAFPGHSVDSEERGLMPSATSSYQWLIDPLDGTENFILGIPYFSSSLALCEGDRPLIAVVYNPVTEELFTAERGKGARRNEEPLYVSRHERLDGARAFFIPDFATKRRPRVVRLRDQCYMRCRRVLDTWSPALDWCLVASGKADCVVTVGATSLRPDAGTLILEEAGGRITDFRGTAFESGNSGQIIGSNGTFLHNELLKLIQEHYMDDGY